MNTLKAGDAMQTAIEHDLTVQATTVMTHIDNTLFERFQNAAIWSQLEVMQDLQVQDVDKRLSNFLTKLKSGYGGVYRAIRVVDMHGTIISSSNAKELGRQTETAGKGWQVIRQANESLWLRWPRTGESMPILLIDAPVMSAFGQYQIGWLELAFDWHVLESMLDDISGGGRLSVLVGPDRSLLAASRLLRDKGSDWPQSVSWLVTAHDHDSSKPPAEGKAMPMMTGIGKSSGRDGVALMVAVAQQRDLALAPVHQMAVWSFGWLALVVVIIVMIASWTSRIIAEPLIMLTRFASRYRAGNELTVPLRSGGAKEVDALGCAFQAMIEEIESSRKRLIQTSKLAVVGEMSSVIAHEVRTPLGIVRSSAQMILREPGLSAEGRELMGFIESETERLNRLVSTMLDSARPRALHKTTVDLHALMERSTTLLSAQMQKHGIHIDMTWQADNAAIHCDEEQMTQVMLNLLLNATQILKDGGRIHLTSHDNPEQISIEIADDGPGIPVSEREQIFEAFFFRREGGVGLGLAIVQQIVHAHGGNIFVQDSKLGGASFLITLPRNNDGTSTI